MNTILTTADGQTAALNSVRWLSPGSSDSPGTIYQALVTAAPEPSTLAIAGLALSASWPTVGRGAIVPELILRRLIVKSTEAPTVESLDRPLCSTVVIRTETRCVRSRPRRETGGGFPIDPRACSPDLTIAQHAVNGAGLIVHGEASAQSCLETWLRIKPLHGWTRDGNLGSSESTRSIHRTRELRPDAGTRTLGRVSFVHSRGRGVVFLAPSSMPARHRP